MPANQPVSLRRIAFRARVAACLEDAPADVRARILRTFDTPATAKQLEALFRCVRSLPTEQRLPFTLRYSQSLPASEIAARLGVPEGVIERRIAVALTAVRELMGPMLDDSTLA